MLHLYDIINKELKKEKVSFTFPKWKGCVHFGNYYYMAGGMLDKIVLKQFYRLTSEGDEKQLHVMLNAKHSFQIAPFNS